MNNKLRFFLIFTVGLLLGLLLMLGLLVYFSDPTQDGVVQKVIFRQTPTKKATEQTVSQPKKASNGATTDAEIEYTIIESTKHVADSIEIYQVNPDAEEFVDDVTIAKDMLITTEVFPIQQVKNGADSLPLKQSEPNYFTVEFWQSPVNYKGYRLESSKLIVFGITDFAQVKLQQKENQLILIYKKQSFPLEKRSDYTAVDFK